MKAPPKVVAITVETDRGTTTLDLSPTEKAYRRVMRCMGGVREGVIPPNIFRVATFGASRIGPTDPSYVETKRLTTRLAEAGIDIVTGGGKGLMEAANSGAMEGKQQNPALSFGLSIKGALDGIPNPHLDKEYPHANFFTRLDEFDLLATGGFVGLRKGGLGTKAEVLLIWQLAQFGLLADRPFVLIGPYWKKVRDQMRDELLSEGTISESDLDLPTYVDDGDAAFEVIMQAYGNFKQKLAAG